MTQTYAPEPGHRIPVTSTARYGASLVAVVLGGYLFMLSPVANLIRTLQFSDGGLDLVALFLLQYLVAVSVLLVGVLMAPAPTTARAIAGGLVLVVAVLHPVLLALHLGGVLRVPALGFFLEPTFVGVLLATTAWLIVRRRRGPSYLLLLATLVLVLVPYLVVMAGLTMRIEFVLIPLAAVIGVGIAWGARAISGPDRDLFVAGR